MEQKSLYVIDDDEIFQFMIVRELQTLDKNLKIQVHSNGHTAAKELRKQNKDLPNIILLDINMPSMDGWEFMDFYTHFKDSITQDISIYMVSSSENPEDIHRAREITDISGYITKPINRNKLRMIIEEKPQEYWMVSSA